MATEFAHLVHLPERTFRALGIFRPSSAIMNKSPGQRP